MDSMHVRMKEESIPEFYNEVARVTGIDPDAVINFNPSKIEVSPDRYEILKGDRDAVSFAMIWLNYGPHAVDDLVGDEVVVHDGFITTEGEDDAQ